MNPVRAALSAASALLVSVILAAPAAAQQRGIDTTYERVDTSMGKHILLFTGDGRSYRMTKKVHSKHKVLWLVLKKGTKIHITVQKRWVLKVARGWKTKSTRSSRVRVEIRKASEGDRVIVDGSEYLFIKADEKYLKVSPKGGSGYEGEETLRIDRIKSFKLAPKVDTGPLNQDTLQIFGVRKGDTLRLGVGRKNYTGGVYKLDKKLVMLLEFTRGRWAKRPRRFLRGEVTKVRHVPLTSVRSFPLQGGGSITVRTQLYRRGSEGRPLEIKLEASHDRKGILLADLSLRIGLSERVGGAHTADAEQVVAAPPLFPGDTFKVTKEAIHPRYVDANPTPEGYKLLLYSDKRAKPYMVKTIDLGGLTPGMLERLYLGAGESHDPDFLRYLMNVIIFPTSKAGLKPAQHAELARKALQRGGLAAAKALVEDITVDDKGVKLTGISKGKLVRDDLPEGMEPDSVRKKMLAELGRIPGALGGELGARMFEYYCRNPKLREPLEATFSAQSKEVMSQLFKVAVPAGQGADPKRVKAANQLIRSLGPESIQYLEVELKRRNVKLERLHKAQKQFSRAQASKVLAVALELAEEWQRGKQSAMRDAEITEALTRAEGGDTEKALATARRILASDSDHKAAKKALPKLLLLHADALAKAGETGPGALLFQEALPLTSRAGPPLAKLLLGALKEDLTGVIFRSAPHPAGALMLKAPKGTMVPGSPRKDGWIEVQSSKGTGYVRKNSVEKQGAKYAVTADFPPSAMFEAGVKKIKSLDPGLATEADEVLGTYYAQLAEQKFKEGKYDEVTPLLEQAEKLAPKDPRLGLATQAWLRSNLLLLIGLLVVVVLGAAGATIIYKKLQKEKEKESAADDASLRITLFTDAMDAGVTAEEDLAREGPMDFGIPDGEA